MNIAAHVIFIPIILAFSYATYAAFFSKNYVRKMWENSKYIPFLPPEFSDFVPVFRGLIVITLVSSVTLYILILTGVI